MNIYIIVEKQDVGGRDTIYRDLVGCEDPYGGGQFPYFKDLKQASDFLETLKGRFEVLAMAEYSS